MREEKESSELRERAASGSVLLSVRIGIEPLIDGLSVSVCVDSLIIC